MNTENRFETWWVRDPRRLALSPDAKEVARLIWMAAAADHADFTALQEHSAALGKWAAFDVPLPVLDHKGSPC